jgi:hypothetical protein
MIQAILISRVVMRLNFKSLGAILSFRYLNVILT